MEGEYNDLEKWCVAIGHVLLVFGSGMKLSSEMTHLFRLTILGLGIALLFCFDDSLDELCVHRKQNKSIRLPVLFNIRKAKKIWQNKKRHRLGINLI